MRAIIFLDWDNFCKSISAYDPKRKEKVSSFSNFITNYIKNIAHPEFKKSNIIRTYLYTGYIEDNLLDKIKKSKYASNIDKYKKMQEFQKYFLKLTSKFNCFEIRTKPLHYDFDNDKLFQKGVDVQLAVDMVTHAYNNNYDIAIIGSGDVDLLDSVKTIKNMGKQVFIIAHTNTCSEAMKKEADFFINIAKLNENEINEFTVFKK